MTPPPSQHQTPPSFYDDQGHSYLPRGNLCSIYDRTDSFTDTTAPPRPPRPLANNPFRRVPDAAAEADAVANAANGTWSAIVAERCTIAANAAVVAAPMRPRSSNVKAAPPPAIVYKRLSSRSPSLTKPAPVLLTTNSPIAPNTLPLHQLTSPPPRPQRRRSFQGQLEDELRLARNRRDRRKFCLFLAVAMVLWTVMTVSLAIWARESIRWLKANGRG